MTSDKIKEPTIREVVDAATAYSAEEEAAAQRRFRAKRRRYVGAYISSGFVITFGFSLFNDIRSALIASAMTLVAAIIAVALSSEE